MCGITGYCGKSPGDISKIKLASIFMESRGKDAVGLLYNNQITKGTFKSGDDKSTPTLFFSGYYFNIKGQKMVSNTILCHNRSSTRGNKYSIDNAHPFMFEKDGERFWFMKNGTITNELELCEKYNLKKSDFDVDSKLLGHIIVHHGWDVLLEYKGAAACVLYAESNPNTIYLFHGESLEGSLLKEERPLYCYNKNNKFYFASTENALVCALDVPKEDIIDMKTNTLFKVTNGVIEEETVYDRSQIQNKVETTYYNNTTNFNRNGSYYNYNKKDETNEKNKTVYYSKNSPMPNPANIIKGNRIYYNAGLYYRNGHPITGKFKLDFFGKEKETAYASECYFYKGLKLINEEAIEVLKNIFRKSKQIPEHINEILPYLDRNSVVFFYQYSETRKEYKLRVYQFNKAVESAELSVYPDFSPYQFIFDIIDNKYQIIPRENMITNMGEEEKLPKKEENEKSTVINLWDERYWENRELFTEETIPEIDLVITNKLKIITKAIERTITSFITGKIINNFSEEQAAKTIEVLNYILKNPTYVDLIYDDMLETEPFE